MREINNSLLILMYYLKFWCPFKIYMFEHKFTLGEDILKLDRVKCY